MGQTTIESDNESADPNFFDDLKLFDCASHRNYSIYTLSLF